MHICTLPSTHPGLLSTLLKKITVATHVMQSSSNKLSTSVADSTKSKQTKVNTYALNVESCAGT